MNQSHEMTIPKKDPTIPLNFPHHFLVLTMHTFPSFPKFIQSIIFGPFHSQRFRLSVETIHSRKPFLLSHDDLGLFKMISAWNHLELPMVHHEQLKLVGGLEHGFYDCPFSWECHVIPIDFHSMIFQRGRYTNHQAVNHLGTTGSSRRLRRVRPGSWSAEEGKACHQDPPQLPCCVSPPLPHAPPLGCPVMLDWARSKEQLGRFFSPHTCRYKILIISNTKTY